MGNLIEFIFTNATFDKISRMVILTLLRDKPSRTASNFSQQEKKVFLVRNIGIRSIVPEINFFEKSRTGFVRPLKFLIKKKYVYQFVESALLRDGIMN